MIVPFGEKSEDGMPLRLEGAMYIDPSSDEYMAVHIGPHGKPARIEYNGRVLSIVHYGWDVVEGWWTDGGVWQKFTVPASVLRDDLDQLRKASDKWDTEVAKRRVAFRAGDLVAAKDTMADTAFAESLGQLLVTGSRTVREVDSVYGCLFGCAAPLVSILASDLSALPIAGPVAQIGCTACALDGIAWSVERLNTAPWFREAIEFGRTSVDAWSGNYAGLGLDAVEGFGTVLQNNPQLVVGISGDFLEWERDLLYSLWDLPGTYMSGILDEVSGAMRDLNNGLSSLGSYQLGLPDGGYYPSDAFDAYDVFYWGSLSSYGSGLSSGGFFDSGSFGSGYAGGSMTSGWSSGFGGSPFDP